MIRATKEQLTEFKESLIWKDICEELENWKRGFQAETLALAENADSANLTTASVMLELGSLSGRMKAADYFASMPDILLSILEGEEDEKDN